MANNNVINKRPDTNRTQHAVGSYGASGVLSEVGPLTNGQLVVGNTGNAPSASTLTSSSSTITVTNGAGTVNLEIAEKFGTEGAWVYPSSTGTNITGDGTKPTIAHDTESWDIGSDFNTGTYTYTSAVTGKFQFSLTVHIIGLLSANTYSSFYVSTSNRTYYIDFRNPYYCSLYGSTRYMWSGDVIGDMDAADTANVKIVVSNGTKVVDSYAGTSEHFNVFILD